MQSCQAFSAMRYPKRTDLDDPQIVERLIQAQSATDRGDQLLDCSDMLTVDKRAVRAFSAGYRCGADRNTRLVWPVKSDIEASISQRCDASSR